MAFSKQKCIEAEVYLGEQGHTRKEEKKKKNPMPSFDHVESWKAICKWEACRYKKM